MIALKLSTSRHIQCQSCAGMTTTDSCSLGELARSRKNRCFGGRNQYISAGLPDPKRPATEPARSASALAACAETRDMRACSDRAPTKIKARRAWKGRSTGQFRWASYPFPKATKRHGARGRTPHTSASAGLAAGAVVSCSRVIWEQRSSAGVAPPLRDREVKQAIK